MRGWVIGSQRPAKESCNELSLVVTFTGLIKTKFVTFTGLTQRLK